MHTGDNNEDALGARTSHRGSLIWGLVVVLLGVIILWMSLSVSRNKADEVLLLPLTASPSVVAASSWVHEMSTPMPASKPTLPPTPSIPSPSATPISLALDPVDRNSDWNPFFQTFDDVEMALVPPGCFKMGSVGVYSNEAPVHDQCFDTPFWIDVYEVTNGQYGTPGYFRGDRLPRETISWFEAAAFCATRDMRLPTEAEWEYAARGPDSPLYPWGNRFEEDYVVYRGNSDGHTGDIGGIAASQSWVGAVDMSGNVGEWVSSLYWLYPYDSSDGREVSGTIDGVNPRVIRGGSWWTIYPLDLRAMTRSWSIPTNASITVGFRCARSYAQ
jgi:hypothetical protein